MTTKKITELPAHTNASGDDLLLVVDSPAANAETRKMTLTNFFANVSANVSVTSKITTNALYLSNTVNRPSSSSAAGYPGEIRVDANYIYVCVSTNTWKRASISSW